MRAGLPHGCARAGEVPRYLVKADKTVDSVCPFCGVGCQLTYHVKDNTIVRVDGRDGPANHDRLCVKGRYGFDYAHHPHRLTKPLIRKPGAPKHGRLHRGSRRAGARCSARPPGRRRSISPPAA